MKTVLAWLMGIPWLWVAVGVLIGWFAIPSLKPSL